VSRKWSRERSRERSRNRSRERSRSIYARSGLLAGLASAERATMPRSTSSSCRTKR